MTMDGNGFSLIELLFVVVIAVLLFALAIPSYQQHITKTKRLEGKIALLDLAARLERYYAEHHSYALATIAQNANTDVLKSALSSHGFYQLAIIAQSPSTFLIQATPNFPKFQDAECGALRLNQWGEKTVTGPGKLTVCW